MGFPVAYRSGARKFNSGGFQEPAIKPPGSPVRNPMKPPYTPPPKPANDPYPRPDNDNVPGRGRWDHPPFPQLPAFPGFDPPALAAGAMGRLLPPGARAAWQVAKVMFQAEQIRNNLAMPNIDFKGQWSIKCGPVPASPAYTGRWGLFKNLGNDNVCSLGGQALPLSAEVQDIEPTQDTLLVAKWSGDTVFDRWYDVMFARRVGTAVKAQVFWPRSTNLRPREVPEPVPVPEGAPLPAYVPSPQGNELPQFKPMPASVPRVRPGVYQYPARQVSSDHWPKPEPGKIENVVVVAPPTVTNPIRKPPGPGVKERKFRTAPGVLVGALGAAAGIYEDAKFYNDVLNAWYNSLPGKKNARTPAEKALELYRRADEIDVNKAVLGVLAAVAGEKAGAYLDKARRVTGDNLGLNMYITIPTGSAPRV